MSDYTAIADALNAPPVMPEAYDRDPTALQWLGTQAQGLKAGFIDPFGLTGYARDALEPMMGVPPEMQGLKSREWSDQRREAPIAAGAGISMTFPVGLELATLAKLGYIPAAETLRGLGLFGSFGGHFGNMFSDMYRPAPRAQGSYPPGGAY